MSDYLRGDLVLFPQYHVKFGFTIPRQQRGNSIALFLNVCYHFSLSKKLYNKYIN